MEVFILWMPRNEPWVRYESTLYSALGEWIHFILTQFSEDTNIVRVLKIMGLGPARHDLLLSVRWSFSEIFL